MAAQLPIANQDTSTDQILVFNQVSTLNVKPCSVMLSARTLSRKLSSLLASIPTTPTWTSGGAENPRSNTTGWRKVRLSPPAGSSSDQLSRVESKTTTAES